MNVVTLINILGFKNSKKTLPASGVMVAKY